MLEPYNLLIVSSLILLISFVFGELSKKTSVPSVLMLIVLGIVMKLGIDYIIVPETPYNFFPYLEILGIVGLIMIVLEAALELELKPEKYIPIAKAFGIAAVGLVLSTWAAASILQYAFEMETTSAWLYATPLSILSSAIIIPSVSELRPDKKEFHIYESTFSDILGIILFYFLSGKLLAEVDPVHHSGGGAAAYAGTIGLTVVISLIASYIIVLIFQNIKSHVKLFLLIAVLLLLYSVGKKMHLSSLIIILVFGLLIANMKLFFSWGPLKKLLKYKEALHIYEGLHVITMETAFVVRTFFFVIFGIIIKLETLASLKVAAISIAIIASIYLIRLVILRLMIGKDIFPQLFVAPRGLITVLLFYAIPKELEVKSFEEGILLFIIIGTSLIMTFAMISDKKRSNVAVRKAERNMVGSQPWTAPTVVENEDTHSH